MCKYCEGIEDISNKIFDNGSKFSDSCCKVRINNSEIYGKALGISPVYYRDGKKEQYNTYIFPINYCPKCGKKLN